MQRPTAQLFRGGGSSLRYVVNAVPYRAFSVILNAFFLSSRALFFCHPERNAVESKDLKVSFTVRFFRFWLAAHLFAKGNLSSTEPWHPQMGSPFCVYWADRGPGAICAYPGGPRRALVTFARSKVTRGSGRHPPLLRRV